jgi:hypothetical protein
MSTIEEQFDEMLDDVYEPITIGFGKYYASDILKNCDPIAYRIGVSEFEDSLEEDED